MTNTDMTLRMMLNNIVQLNSVGPRPTFESTQPMHAPRNSFSLVIEVITNFHLSMKKDGRDVTSYQDSCILTPIGTSYLASLNKEFERAYLFH